MSFSENLKAIRKSNHLSQEDLAEMLGVSRQAVSKWERGDGYPEVEKLMILSQKLGVSLDYLLENETFTEPAREDRPAHTIRIESPHEGVIMDVSNVTRSQAFKGGKNSPKYALFAVDLEAKSFWGAPNTFLAWYRDLEDITKEISEIRLAMDAGEVSYTLQYSVKCKQNLLRTIEE